jgi:hypothetical protein
MKFDLVNGILTDAKIKELQALCAKTVSDILADINDYETLKAAKGWIKQVRDRLYTMRNHGKAEGFTFDNMTEFLYNRCKYDQRFKWQTEFYCTRSKVVANRLLEFENRWSDDSLMILVTAISDGLQGWYDSGRKIPKNQWWEEDFEVDRVLWRLMTAYHNDLLSQRDTPSNASKRTMKPSLVTNCIVSYLRCVSNACALCSLLEEIYGQNGYDNYYNYNGYDKNMIHVWDNLSRLLPGIIDDLYEIYVSLNGGVQ